MWHLPVGVSKRRLPAVAPLVKRDVGAAITGTPVDARPRFGWVEGPDPLTCGVGSPEARARTTSCRIRRHEEAQVAWPRRLRSQVAWPERGRSGVGRCRP